MSTQENAASAAAPQVQQVSLTQIHALLDSGMNREQIQAQFGWSKAQLKSVFAHPTLKNRRGKQNLGIELIEDYTAPEKKTKKAATTTTDTPVDETPSANPTTEAAPTPAPVQPASAEATNVAPQAPISEPPTQSVEAETTSQPSPDDNW